jgi:hypothetical protein
MTRMTSAVALDRLWAMRSLLPSLCCTVLALACGGARVPDPQQAVSLYQRAVEQNDAAAIREMLSERAREDWSTEDIARVLKRDREELGKFAKDLNAQSKTVALARLELEDGTEAELELHAGAYGVLSAGDLPGGATSPEGALIKLSHALQKRKYGALLRTLSPATRRIATGTLDSLVRGLKAPHALDVQVQGESANVAVPGGHAVQLRMAQGLWYVENFR